MPLYAKNLGASGIWLGLIFSIFSITRTLTLPLFGKVSDKLGKKPLIISGLSLYIAFSLMYVVSTSITSLIVVRAFHGIASAMVVPVAMAYVAETAPKEEIGKVMGTFNIFLFLGIGVGPLFGGLLSDFDSYFLAFYGMAAVTGVALLLSILLIPPFSPPDAKKDTNMMKLLKNRIFRLLLLFRLSNAVGRGSIMAFVPIYAAKIGLNTTQIGTIVSVNILVSALLQRKGGELADRSIPELLVFIGTAIAALSLILLPETISFLQIFLLSVMFGLSSSISLPSAVVIAAKAGEPKDIGSAMGLYSGSRGAGRMIGPIIAGAITEWFGLRYAFYAAGLISLIGALVFYLAAKSYRLPPSTL
jgi:MFS family permease